MRGLLLAGSIAHGFASEASDVDVMIVVSDDDQEARLQRRNACFFSRERCTYEAGYVDGKYVSEDFIRKVIDRGSEPARFAFASAKVLFTRSPELEGLVAEAALYPTAEKEARIRRFQAQFQAWSWFAQDAQKRADAYLLCACSAGASCSPTTSGCTPFTSGYAHPGCQRLVVVKD